MPAALLARNQCSDHPLSDGIAVFTSRAILIERAFIELRDFNMDIDAIEQRPGDARQIALDLTRLATAGLVLAAVVAAGAGVALARLTEAVRRTDVGEELLDAFTDGLAARSLKLLLGTRPEAALPGLTLFSP